MASPLSQSQLTACATNIFRIYNHFFQPSSPMKSCGEISTPPSTLDHSKYEIHIISGSVPAWMALPSRLNKVVPLFPSKLPFALCLLFSIEVFGSTSLFSQDPFAFCQSSIKRKAYALEFDLLIDSFIEIKLLGRFSVLCALDFLTNLGLAVPALSLVLHARSPASQMSSL